MRREPWGAVTGLRVLIAMLALLVAGCSGANAGDAGGRPADGRLELRVAAAASLGPAIDRAARAYEARHPGVSVRWTLGSSAALRAQIEQGAPVDAFLSADETNAGAVADEGLTTGRATVFARNRLALVVPPGNPGAVHSPADLARPGLRIVAAGEGVPVSHYAADVVARLARVPGYPPGFADAYARNVVSREESVAAVLAKVELGEGDAAFVYETDALAAGARVARIDIPSAANVVASYAGVVVAGGRDEREAEAFLAWLAGPEGQAVLGSFGFLAVQ